MAERVEVNTDRLASAVEESAKESERLKKKLSKLSGEIANKDGINTINSFLNSDISKKYENKADLVTASNVFAHNKDIIKLAKHLVSLMKKMDYL